MKLASRHTLATAIASALTAALTAALGATNTATFSKPDAKVKVHRHGSRASQLGYIGQKPAFTPIGAHQKMTDSATSPAASASAALAKVTQLDHMGTAAGLS